MSWMVYFEDLKIAKPLGNEIAAREAYTRLLARWRCRLLAPASEVDALRQQVHDLQASTIAVANFSGKEAVETNDAVKAKQL